MTEAEKKQRLRRYQSIATGMLLLMALVFVSTFWLIPEGTVNGYVRSFSEAAMVGALADWFAVTALFRHPMGLPIPHTNLIESNKDNIGQNLGQFVTDNFLNSENIKPRIGKINISSWLAGWIEQEQNLKRLVQEIERILKDIIQGLSDQQAEQLLKSLMKELVSKINWNQIAGNLLQEILEKGQHEALVTKLGFYAADFIAQNKNLIKDKIKEQGKGLIPDFLSDLIAGQVAKGIQSVLIDMATQPNHPQRQKIKTKLLQLAEDLRTKDEWVERIDRLKQQWLPEEKLALYAGQAWQFLKPRLLSGIEDQQGPFHLYLKKSLQDLAQHYLKDPDRSRAVDELVQVQVFKLIMRNRKEVTGLISETIHNWESDSLSRKLELEVGKDLQFIRLNGTLVGGLVGLFIHFVTQFF